MDPHLSGATVWPAPGKLNLFLRIVGRRADGYHLLQTAFQFIDRCDDLRFRVRADGLVRSLHPLAGVPAEKDLTLRAARLLKQTSSTPLGADIELTKKLPLGGGLGGGSSDAATTLMALNRLWGLGLPLRDLVALGLVLGADVPVFLRGRSAWAEGIGEQLTPVDWPVEWYLVVVPPGAVSTAAVFADPTLTRDSLPATISDFRSGSLENDCLPVVRRRYPSVARAMDWLARYGEARLTGTGGCVFAAYASREEAEGVLARVPAGWAAFIAKGLNRSPLHVFLGDGE